MVPVVLVACVPSPGVTAVKASFSQIRQTQIDRRLARVVARNSPAVVSGPISLSASHRTVVPLVSSVIFPLPVLPEDVPLGGYNIDAKACWWWICVLFRIRPARMNEYDLRVR